jgi:hypothetical protein
VSLSIIFDSLRDCSDGVHAIRMQMLKGEHIAHPSPLRRLMLPNEQSPEGVAGWHNIFHDIK